MKLKTKKRELAFYANMLLASTRNFHKGNIPPGEIRSKAETVMHAASVSVLSDMILCLPADI